MSIRLHINIDHVATVRNARGTVYPDPVFAAQICELAGADGITAHLREDRRHIRDEDVTRLRQSVNSHLNLEIAATDEMREIAGRIVPDTVTLVPERREERTTEGGLDVEATRGAIEGFVKTALSAGFRVSLFVAPDVRTIRIARDLGVAQVELHTGEYAHAVTKRDTEAAERELDGLIAAANEAHALGLEVAAGHGLTRHNLAPIARMPHLAEVNIGHAVIADALFSGLDAAVKAFRVALTR
jgi:pyridoxine 5-phosphate synthase